MSIMPDPAGGLWGCLFKLLAWLSGSMLIIGSFLGALVYGLVTSGEEGSLVLTARSEVLGLTCQLQRHALLNAGRYPASLIELRSLSGEGRQDGSLTDPWGHAYQYVPPTLQAPFPRVICLGSDGQVGGTGDAADIDPEVMAAWEGR